MKTDFIANEDLCRFGELKAFCAEGTARRRLTYKTLQPIRRQKTMRWEKEKVTCIVGRG